MEMTTWDSPPKSVIKWPSYHASDDMEMTSWHVPLGDDM